jgi:hypothetical protein
MTVQVAEAPADDAPQVLNHSTRCDRCGARAYVAVILRQSRKLPQGGELLACAHHWREWAKHIKPAALIDETAQLYEHVKDDRHWVEGMRVGQK